MLNIKQLTLAVLQKVRENALDEVPVSKGTNSGELSGGIDIRYRSPGLGAVGVYTIPYAAAVHNGRRALTIRPNLDINPPRGDRVIKGSKESYRPRARLKFKIGGQNVFAREVKQPSRPPNPFLIRAVTKTQTQGFDFLLPTLKKGVENEVYRDLVKTLKIEFVI